MEQSKITYANIFSVIVGILGIGIVIGTFYILLIGFDLRGFLSGVFLAILFLGYAFGYEKHLQRFILFAGVKNKE